MLPERLELGRTRATVHEHSRIAARIELRDTVARHVTRARELRTGVVAARPERIQAQVDARLRRSSAHDVDSPVVAVDDAEVCVAVGVEVETPFELVAELFARRTGRRGEHEG